MKKVYETIVWAHRRNRTGCLWLRRAFKEQLWNDNAVKILPWKMHVYCICVRSGNQTYQCIICMYFECALMLHALLILEWFLWVNNGINRHAILILNDLLHFCALNWCGNELCSQRAEFIGTTWDPPGFCRAQMDPMLAPWTLLSRLPTHIFGWFYW